MRCDLCGKEGELYKTLVEGTELNVCKECKSFGKVIEKVQNKTAKKMDINIYKKNEEIKETEILEFVKEDIGELIKKKREKLGLTQEDFAKKVAVKESVIQNIESGHFEPSIDMAKKIGKFLRLNLVEEVKDERKDKRKDVLERELTLGDLIEIKMRHKK